jgi:hypothetical protein
VALSVLVSDEVPFPVKLLQRAFPLVKHQVLYLLGALPHLRKLAVDLHELNPVLVLTDDAHQALQVTLPVYVPALVLHLVYPLLDLLDVHDPHFAFIMLDFIFPDIVHLKRTVLKGQHLAVQVRLLDLAGNIEYLLLEGRHFLLVDVLQDPDFPLFHVDKAYDEKCARNEQIIELKPTAA